MWSRESSLSAGHGHYIIEAQSAHLLNWGY